VDGLGFEVERDLEVAEQLPELGEAGGRVERSLEAEFEGLGAAELD
jgi:hypothetical protein